MNLKSEQLLSELTIRIAEVVTIPTDPEAPKWVAAFITQCVEDKLQEMSQTGESYPTWKTLEQEQQ